jgi:hypothetical protein
MFLDEVAGGEADGRLAFLEIAPENYMHRGGRVPQKLERVASRFPVITHGLMMSLGSTDPFDEAYFEVLRGFLDRYDVPYHSDHVCWSGLHGSVLHDLLPVPFTSTCARRIADRIRDAQDRLGRPMAFENISWYLELGQSSQTETEFLAEILDRADCKLLLDVNNVFVNSINHNFDAHRWLADIPLDRVVQLHVAGHEPWDDELVIDTHGETVCDEVYELMAWVIERTGPKPVVLERDSNIPPLAELLQEVRRLDDIYQVALGRWEASRAESLHGR